MNRFAHFLAAGALTFGTAGPASGQTASSPHQQHGQPPAASQSTPSLEHRGPGHPPQGEHAQDCRSCCCRMMMEIMQRHGMPAPGAARSESNEHQQHQGQRPN